MITDVNHLSRVLPLNVGFFESAEKEMARVAVELFEGRLMPLDPERWLTAHGNERILLVVTAQVTIEIECKAAARAEAAKAEEAEAPRTLHRES